MNPNRQDFANCLLLLAFLQQSFAGATIGNLNMDDAIKSFENILAPLAERRQQEKNEA